MSIAPGWGASSLQPIPTPSPEFNPVSQIVLVNTFHAHQNEKNQCLSLRETFIYLSLNK